MQIWGVIKAGKLTVIAESRPDAKPIVYADVPKFDQTTQFVVQQEPVDAGSHIFMGCEIRETEISEDNGVQEVTV